MSYPELLDHYRTARQGMADAKNEFEKAVWAVMFRWATEEIRRFPARTGSALNQL